MSTKKTIALFTILGLAALAIALPWNTVIADDNDEGGGHCRLEGLWIGTFGSSVFTISDIPLDPQADRVFGIVETTGRVDPTNGGMFPTAVGETDARGVAERTGPNTYQGSLVRYLYDASGAVVATEIQIVDIVLIDCDSMEFTFLSWSFYDGFVNPGLPLPEPDICQDVSGFPAFTAEQMLPAVPCEP